MRKCLIVQFEARHEEVIPSVIAACNAAGYRPTVALNRRILRLRGDIFELVRGGEAEIRYDRLSAEPDELGSSWRELLTDGVDFVVLNTLNRQKVATWAKNCGKPVIAIVHNVDQFMGNSAFYEALNRPEFSFLTLGPHVTSELLSRLGEQHIDKFGQLTPCVLSDAPPIYDVSEPRKVVVQGNMTLRTRDYQGLINALSKYRGRWDNLTFEFPSSGEHRDEIEAMIVDRGLATQMQILPAGSRGEVPYSQLFESLRSATLLHPLIPKGFTQYQRIKITSTASMSVGFGVPVVMDRWSESCYRFPMLVADNSLEDSLDRLSEVESETLLQISGELAAYRDRMMLKSGQDMARLVSQIL